MATQNKPVLGYRECPDCQTRASIHQATGKRASYLYQRCECGCLQGSGAWVQTRYWFETEWIEGMKPEPPPNVKPEAEWLGRYGPAGDGGVELPDDLNNNPETGSEGAADESDGPAELSSDSAGEPEPESEQEEAKPVARGSKVRRAGFAVGLMVVGAAILRGLAGS